MAKVGLIEQAPGRGDGRERLWRTAAGGVDVSVDGSGTATEEQLSAAMALAQVVIDRDDAAARSWLTRSDAEPAEWQDAISWTSNRLVLTAAELKELNGRLQELFTPYRRSVRPDAPAGARTVSVVFRAFPHEYPQP
jgi:hypothetical protein